MFLTATQLSLYPTLLHASGFAWHLQVKVLSTSGITSSGFASPLQPEEKTNLEADASERTGAARALQNTPSSTALLRLS